MGKDELGGGCGWDRVLLSLEPFQFKVVASFMHVWNSLLGMGRRGAAGPEVRRGRIEYFASAPHVFPSDHCGSHIGDNARRNWADRFAPKSRSGIFYHHFGWTLGGFKIDSHALFIQPSANYQAIWVLWVNPKSATIQPSVPSILPPREPPVIDEALNTDKD